MPRATKNPGIFAADAQTTIPPTPVVGVSYRDPVNGLDNIRDGWPFKQIVNSPEFAQILHELTSLTDLVDRTGILEYKDDVVYDLVPAYVQGSDGVLYVSAIANGPGTGAGVVDPVGDVSGTWAAYLNLTGQVASFATSSPPSGWLKANGAAVSRTTYASLFSVIGTTFGVGDGSTTFNLPDLRGEFLRGWDDGRGVDSGRVFGSFQEASGIATNPLSNGANAFANTDGTYGGVTTFTQSSSSSGGDTFNRTRPRNIALLQCIKF